jgi:aspartate aminotransferase/aminotransferase
VTQVLKVNQHLITCPATILEYYLTRHFEEILAVTRPQIRDLIEHRQELATYMDEIGLRYSPGATTFYFFVSIAPSKLTSEKFATRLLDEHRVSVVPGVGYGSSCDGYIRVSIGTASLEDNRRGLRAIKALVDATK